MKSNKAFTLIELLVVITVIGLLSSMVLVGLQGVRAQGRDTRRVADLRNIQNALELYFNKNSSYPLSADTSITSNSSDWSTLRNDVNMRLPVDPLNKGASGYYYSYAPGTNGLHYVLHAKLEDANNAALKDRLTAGEFSNWGLGSTVDCTTDATSYCIGI